MKLPTLTQSYKDGVVKIYRIKNISEDGDMPKDEIELKEDLRYDEKTVGMSRFWTAKQSQAQIQRLLRVPKIITVSTQDIAVPVDGEQYKILQIQYPENVEPPSMDLSLERLDVDYEIAGP